MAGKRFIAFFLLLLYCASLPGLSEVCRFPLLVEHYFDHKGKGNILEHAGDYLIQHYLHENGTDRDAAEDAQLPFKSAVCFIYAPVAALVPFQHVEAVPVFLLQDYPASRQHMLPDDYFASIWQPPRAV